jgi:crossover junction endodeoxyribonuclease RusA
MATEKIIENARITAVRAWKVDTAAVPPGCAPAGPGALTVWVEGVPAPQGSKRHVGRGVMIESSKKVKPWRAAVAEAASVKMITGSGLHLGLGAGTPAMVKIVFVLPRTKAMRARPGGAFPMAQKPDIDKLVRSTLDALGTAGVWCDDSQVVTVHAHKRRGEPGEPTGALIHVELVPAAVVPLDAPRVLNGLPCCETGSEAAPEPCPWHPRPVDHAQCACGHFSGAHVGAALPPGRTGRCWVTFCPCRAFAPLAPSAVQ